MSVVFQVLCLDSCEHGWLLSHGKREDDVVGICQTVFQVISTLLFFSWSCFRASRVFCVIGSQSFCRCVISISPWTTEMGYLSLCMFDPLDVLSCYMSVNFLSLSFNWIVWSFTIYTFGSQSTLSSFQSFLSTFRLHFRIIVHYQRQILL